MTSVTAAIPAGGEAAPARVGRSPAPGFDLLLGGLDGEPDGSGPASGPASTAPDEGADQEVPVIGLLAVLLPGPVAAPPVAAPPVAAPPVAAPPLAAPPVAAAAASGIEAAPPSLLSAAEGGGRPLDAGAPGMPPDAGIAIAVPAGAATGGPALESLPSDGTQAPPRPDVVLAVSSATRDAAGPSPAASPAHPGQPAMTPARVPQPDAQQVMARQASAPVPVMVDARSAGPALPAGGSRTVRLGLELVRAAPSAESLAQARPGDPMMAPLAVVAAADAGSQPPQSGPEWTEAGPTGEPAARVPDTLPEDPEPVAEAPLGHVHSARLALGAADRLSVTLAAASEASRALLEQETGQLASDLAAAGAIVEAIRVDLATRVNPDGRADGAGGQHPGPEQGGGAPWERGARPDRPFARTSDAPAESRAPRPSGPGASDGGKVDRYA